MPAQAMPPATPAIRMASTIQRPVSLSASSATPPAEIAPITNCPSAPMFQTLERKHTASPSAITSSGVALTISSPRAYGVLTGSQKKTCRPLTGSLPSAMNRATPISTVMTSASSGEP
ncbi:MAG: hypothetical protein BWX79_01808 [Alphaproteobacteria bacterium ADurb.Bin100]|nr:MAG: hypothetical protein BWX79_01808 [Alphaproteobacteria bacterium ADurb.Bin100]